MSYLQKYQDTNQPFRAHVRLLRYFLPFIFIVCISSLSSHADTLPPSHQWRKFNKEEIEKFRSDRHFDYTERKPTKAKESMDWFHKLLERLFRSKWEPNVNRSIFDFINITIIVLVIILAIWAFMKLRFRWFVTDKGAKRSIDSDFIVEDIHDINYDYEIEKAEQEKDFRSAIRYRYLYLLKTLSDNELIDWQPQKTNYEYSKELYGTIYAEPYTILTGWFEFTCYGGFDTDAQTYQSIKNRFLAFPINKQPHKITNKNG